MDTIRAEHATASSRDGYLTMGYVASVAETIRLPDAAWHRAEVRDAAAARDIPALLRYAQHYTGASQGRLAVAFDMTQSRVNEIINRRRAVTTLDVFERIASGLEMPDDVRMLLGLAPLGPTPRSPSPRCPRSPRSTRPRPLPPARSDKPRRTPRGSTCSR